MMYALWLLLGCSIAMAGEAEDLLTEGRSRLEANDMEAALKAFQGEGLALLENELGTDAVELGDTLAMIGTAQFMAGRPQDAKPAFERALDLVERHLPPDDPAMGEVQLSVCTVSMSWACTPPVSPCEQSRPPPPRHERARGVGGGFSGSGEHCREGPRTRPSRHRCRIDD